MAILEMGDCPIHGLVPVWRLNDTTRPDINTGACCQTCYIERVKENVTKVANPRLVQI